MYPKIDTSMQMSKDLMDSIPPSVREFFPNPEDSEESCHHKMTKKIASTFILWLISKEPTTGYALIKKLEVQHPGAMAHASRIYPVLVKMEGEGLLKSKTLKTGKRESKEYSITPKGKLLIKVTNKLLSRTIWGEFLRDISKK